MNPEEIFKFIKHHVETLSEKDRLKLADLIKGKIRKTPKSMTEDEKRRLGLLERLNDRKKK